MISVRNRPAKILAVVAVLCLIVLGLAMVLQAQGPEEEPHSPIDRTRVVDHEENIDFSAALFGPEIVGIFDDIAIAVAVGVGIGVTVAVAVGVAIGLAPGVRATGMGEGQHRDRQPKNQETAHDQLPFIGMKPIQK